MLKIRYTHTLKSSPFFQNKNYVDYTVYYLFSRDENKCVYKPFQLILIKKTISATSTGYIPPHKKKNKQ